MKEMVPLLMAAGHSYAQAYEIALDAMRGEEYAISWIIIIAQGEEHEYKTATIN